MFYFSLSQHKHRSFKATLTGRERESVGKRKNDKSEVKWRKVCVVLCGKNVTLIEFATCTMRACSATGVFLCCKRHSLLKSLIKMMMWGVLCDLLLPCVISNISQFSHTHAHAHGMDAANTMHYKYILYGCNYFHFTRFFLTFIHFAYLHKALSNCSTSCNALA